MKSAHFISAVGTPLTPQEDLHETGLEAHLADQWNNRIGGVLIAGTMGMMPLLRDPVYAALARRGSEFSKGKGEIMIGAGDCSFGRTLDRIRFLNTLKIDAAVVLTPFFIRFSQEEITQYYTALADASKAPLFLYDLPQRTHCKIEIDTVLKLAKHPNIRGIKCSDDPLSYARRLIDELGDSFRVIIAQPQLVDLMLKFSMHEHLDGIYALAPALTKSIDAFALKNDWENAAKSQRKLTGLLQFFGTYGFPAFTALLNARGIPGNFSPLPYRPLTPAETDALLAAPEIVELLRTERPA